MATDCPELRALRARGDRPGGLSAPRARAHGLRDAAAPRLRRERVAVLPGAARHHRQSRQAAGVPSDRLRSHSWRWSPSAWNPLRLATSARSSVTTPTCSTRRCSRAGIRASAWPTELTRRIFVLPEPPGADRRSTCRAASSASSGTPTSLHCSVRAEASQPQPRAGRVCLHIVTNKRPGLERSCDLRDSSVPINAARRAYGRWVRI